MTTIDLTDGAPELSIYLLASSTDRAACAELRKHLAPLTLDDEVAIQLLDDFTIPEGADVEAHRRRLLQADVVLALVTADFIDDNSVYERSEKVMERYNRRETLLATVLLEYCMWQITPLAEVEVLPGSRKPVTSRKDWDSEDEALTTVADELHGLLVSLAEVEVVPAPPSSRVATVAAPEDDTAVDAEAADATGPAEATDLSDGAGEPPAPDAPPVRRAVASDGPPSGPDAESDGATAVAVRMRIDEHEPVDTSWRAGFYRKVIARRFAAWAIDAVLLFVAAVILAIPFVPPDPDATGGDTEILLIFGFLLLIAIPFMESRFGGTPGKRMLGLRITDKQGRRISFGRALARSLVRAVVFYAFILVVPLIYQIIRFRRTNKLLHDELTGTVISLRD